MNSMAWRVVEAASKLPEAIHGVRFKIIASFEGFPEVGKKRPPSPEIKVDLLLRGPNAVDAYPEKEAIPARLQHRQLAKLLPSGGRSDGWRVVHASGDRGIEEFGGYMWRRHIVIIGRERGDERSGSEVDTEVRGSDSSG